MPFAKQKKTKLNGYPNKCAYGDQANISPEVKTKSKNRKTKVDSLYDDLSTVYQTRNNNNVAAGSCSRLRTRKENSAEPAKKRKIIKNEMVPRGRKFSKGDFVIGDIKSFGWWFGKIVESSVKGKSKDLVHIYWYGDHKTLEYPRSHLLSYYKFPTVYEKSKKPLYKKAVQEFLTEIHAHYTSNDMLVPDSLKPSKLLEWALNDFQVKPEEENQNKKDVDNLAKEKVHLNLLTDQSSSSICVAPTDQTIEEVSDDQTDINVEDSFNQDTDTDDDNTVDGQKNKSFAGSSGNSVHFLDEVLSQQNVNALPLKVGNQNVATKSLPLNDNEQVQASHTAGSACFEENEDADYKSSTSTVHYDLVETAENSKRLVKSNPSDRDIAIKKRKIDGGIQLDYDLIGKPTAKRGCTIKEDLPVPLEGKKHKKQQRRKLNPSLNTLDLPVLSSTSKILSWDCATSTPLKSLDDGAIDDASDKSIRINDLVIAKLKGFDWWFGKVVSYQRARKSPPADGSCWVYWYGDHKLSEIPLSSCEHLSQFSVRFLLKKLRGQYLTSVEEILNEAALRCGKVGVSIHLPREEQIEQLKDLIEWAMNGFQPHGINALRSPIEVIEQLEKEIDGNSDKDSKSDNGNNVIEDGRNFIPILNEEIKLLFDRVAAGKASIEDLCLACGDTKVFASHPLFEGGLCKECKESFLESAFLYDDSGSQMYCCVCSEGEHIFMCDNIGCQRSYCPVCIDMLCGVGYSERISSSVDEWYCFMCEDKTVRLLKVRHDWQDRIKDIFNEEQNHIDFGPQVYYDPVPFEERKSIRVLSLFDGIATALHVLKKMNFDVELYVAAEIDSDALKVAETHHGCTIKHVGDVCEITRKHIEEWGPFDLLVGGSPCNDLSIANPLRKGIYDGTGRLFFEYYRILQYAMSAVLDPTHRPFFWLFENVVGMRYDDRDVITRFLQCNPTIISAKDLSPQQRVRYYWGNLPGMNRPLCGITNQNLSLQDCLEPNCGRTAKVEKVRCITTKRTSLKQQNKLILPVHLEHSATQQTEDELWITEVERIFGFPEHYTDIGNMGQRQRQKLLGKSWSVPVIQHLLMPLKDYFKTKAALPPTDGDDACAHQLYDAETQTEELIGADAEMNSLIPNETSPSSVTGEEPIECSTTTDTEHNLDATAFSDEQDAFYTFPSIHIQHDDTMLE